MPTRVLIIDDDEAIRESMKKILQREDYEVLLADDGRTALEQFDPHHFDLLLLDIDLPVRSGWEVFEEFTMRNPSLPVVVITGHSDQYRIARAAGVGAFMEKPIDPPKLLQTMRDVLAEPEENRLQRLVGRGSKTRHVPASAEMIFEEFRERHSSPSAWELSPMHFAPHHGGPVRPNESRS